MAKKIIRAIAKKDNAIGKERYKLFAEVIERIQKAEKEGFYLEAIALLESIIADRLESRLCYITGSNVGFHTLGFLIRLIKLFEKQTQIIKVADQIEKWSKKRNTCLHEMAKIALNNSKTWVEKVNFCEDTISEGIELFREIDILKRLPKDSS
ncbi:MAG: hypothetical protein QGI16_06850 [Candidatus Marinimicrobia bacterium]|jgi:hypothetical protein|nr:hypothetical protein [Candidatus Neomarinimicrobiota bacterium]MDP7026632.1 hypothetical protein [Candidatus Neomarinimicrobiota bacterium]|tara:strand:- start:560 stop:1018 length:459 start_codon:yes stop_codon:yes gene_type:complete